MKTLLTLLGSITVTAQPAVLFADQTGLLTIQPRLSGYETVKEESFAMEGIDTVRPEIKITAHRHEDWAIDRSSLSSQFKDGIPNFSTTIKTNYKVNDNIEERLFYLSETLGTDQPKMMYEFKEVKDPETGKTSSDFILIDNIELETSAPQNFLSSFTTTVDNGWRVEERYIIYTPNNKRDEVVFYDTKNNADSGVKIKLSNNQQVAKIYSPNTKSQIKENNNSVFIVTTQNEVIRFNLTDYIESNGDFKENTSVLTDTDERITTKYGETPKKPATSTSSFFIGNDGYIVYRPEGDNVFYSQLNDFKEPEKIKFEDESTNYNISYISNTRHARDTESRERLPEYTILAASDNTTPNSPTAIYYVEPGTPNAKKLFDLKPQASDPNQQSGWENFKPLTESDQVLNMETYYNKITQEYNIAISTDLGAYNYSYKEIKDMIDGTKNTKVEKMMFLDSYKTGVTSTNSIIKNSLIYYNGELKFNHAVLDPKSGIKTQTYTSSLIKRYDLSRLTTPTYAFVVDDDVIKENQETKTQKLIEEYDQYLRSENLNNPLYQNLFKKSVLGADYEIKVNDKAKNNLFPTNQYGKIQADEYINIVAKENSNFSRFKGSHDQLVSVDYSHLYNLTDLNQSLEEMWKDPVKYDDFNHAIGYVYKSIENVLSQVQGFENKYLPENEVYGGIAPQYELNTWYAEENSKSYLSNWGLYNPENRKQLDNGYIQITLDNIWITNSSTSELFYVKNKAANDDNPNIIQDEDTKRIYSKLPKLTMIVKDVEALEDSSSSTKSQTRKLDLQKGAEEVSKLQFNGLGLTTSTEVENLQKLEQRLNNHPLLSPGYGIALINGADFYSLNQFETKIKIRLYDKAFGMDSSMRSQGNNQSSSTDKMNYVTVEVKIYGLKKVSNLPAWLTPVFATTGILIAILFITTVWFISRKRFYKSAIGKEAAKVAHAKMKEEQITNKKNSKSNKE